MRVQEVAPVMPSGGFMTLERCLYLHRRLHPLMAWPNRDPIILIIPVAVAIAGILYSQYSNDALFLVLALLFYYTHFAFAIILDRMWRRNIIRISMFNNVTAVGPLLDLTDVTFLSLYRTKVKPMPKTEAIVLPYLPALLARMPAGDGPALTLSQKSALIRLVYSSKYREHFSQPGLREKIDAMVKP